MPPKVGVMSPSFYGSAAHGDGDDDEIAYFTVHQKHEITPTKTVKTENGPISRGSQSGVSMVRDLWGKRLTKKVSFEFRVKE